MRLTLKLNIKNGIMSQKFCYQKKEEDEVVEKESFDMLFVTVNEIQNARKTISIVI